MSKKNPTKASSGVIKQALPNLELPEFEGIVPVGVVTKVNGSGQRIVEGLHYNQRVVLVVEAHVDDVSHKKTKDGMKRRHTLAVDDLWLVDDTRGSELLQEVRAEWRKAQPQLSLEDLGTALMTDESGVVMTDQEKAEALAADRAAAAELEAGRSNGPLPPWDDYDTHGVGVVVNRLAQTSDRELVLQVGSYEEGHKNRAGVLAAVTARSAALLASNGQ